MLTINTDKTISFFKLIRSINLLILACTQYLTALFLIQDSHSDIQQVRLICLILSTCFIAASGYIINDYYDIKIDTINKIDKVIIGKVITRRLAIILHTILNITGIGLGFIASWEVGVITFFAAFILWLYSNQLKRLPFSGNIVIACLTSLSILLVGVFFQANSPQIYLYALFAFFISLLREIIKDMQDMKGDLAFGCRTLPITIGIRKTKQLLYFIQILFLISLGLIFFYFPFNIRFYFLFTLLPALLYLNIKMISADTSKDYKFLSNWCKIIMLIGMISMLFI